MRRYDDFFNTVKLIRKKQTVSNEQMKSLNTAIIEPLTHLSLASKPHSLFRVYRFNRKEKKRN
jgi:hypothetical protein